MLYIRNAKRLIRWSLSERCFLKDRPDKLIGGRLDNMYLFGNNLATIFRYMGIVYVIMALFAVLIVYCTFILSEILVWILIYGGL